MRVFINPTGQWATPYMTGLADEFIEAPEDATLQAVANRALSQAGVELDRTWIWLVEQPDDRGRQRMTSLSAVIDDEGILRWLPEGVGNVTVQELNRTYEASLFKGDPDAICVERLYGGNGILPGWEDFFSWLLAGAGGVAFKMGVDRLRQVLRRHFKRWQKRGAQSSYAFLDVVLTRDAWRDEQIAQLLQIQIPEARDVLEALGYLEGKRKGEYKLSKDPEVGELRRRILKDFLHRDPEE